MTIPRPHHKRLLPTKTLCLLLPLLLILLGFPQMTSVSAQRPLEGVRNLSLPSAQKADELTRLRNAVVAAQDQIDDLQKKLKAADAAVDSLTLAVESAKQAFEANRVTREAYENSLALADKAIKQQQDLIATYQSAIKTLQELVGMVMARVASLEKERDSANKRAALMGIVLTAVGVLASLRK